jgi:hypothetical protein
MEENPCTQNKFSNLLKKNGIRSIVSCINVHAIEDAIEKYK